MLDKQIFWQWMLLIFFRLLFHSRALIILMINISFMYVPARVIWKTLYTYVQKSLTICFYYVLVRRGVMLVVGTGLRCFLCCMWMSVLCRYFLFKVLRCCRMSIRFLNYTFSLAELSFNCVEKCVWITILFIEWNKLASSQRSPLSEWSVQYKIRLHSALK